MTPTLAQKHLSLSQGMRQRSLRRSYVSRLVAAIGRGEFKTTHQPVAIDTDGMILDGQHRLAAVVESGTAVDLLVAWDVDPDTFDVIDIGIARRASDTLTIAGYGNANVLAAAARDVLAWENQQPYEVWNTPSSFYRNVTTHQIVEFLERDEKLLDSLIPAGRIAGALGRHRLRSHCAAGLALIARRHDGQMLSAQAEFAARLEDGELLPPGSPIGAYRRWAVSLDARANRVPQIIISNLVLAWNDWSEGTERRGFNHRPGTSPAPAIS